MAAAILSFYIRPNERITKTQPVESSIPRPFISHGGSS